MSDTKKLASEDTSFKRFMDWVFECHLPFKKEGSTFNDDTKFVYEEREVISMRLKKLFNRSSPSQSEKGSPEENFYETLSIFNKKGPIGYLFRSMLNLKNIEKITIDDIKRVQFTENFSSDLEIELRIERITYAYIFDKLCFSHDFVMDTETYLKSREEVISIYSLKPSIKFNTSIQIKKGKDNEPIFDLYTFLTDYILLGEENFYLKIFPALRRSKNFEEKKEEFTRKISEMFKDYIHLLRKLISSQKRTEVRMN